MNTPAAGGSYVRQPDGTLKLVEETAQLGSDKHEGAAEPDKAPKDEAPQPARQKR
jgi:hypothetical protein